MTGAHMLGLLRLSQDAAGQGVRDGVGGCNGCAGTTVWLSGRGQGREW